MGQPAPQVLAGPSIPFEDATMKMSAVSSIMNQHIIGQQEITETILACMIAGDHISLKGLPGTGKTRMVLTAGAALGLITARVQYGPDTMPADILGKDVLKEDPEKKDGLSHLVFEPGPILKTQLYMADEINRASTRVHAATLQPMQERRVTIGGTTYPLLKPFFTFATQNPHDYSTNPLPDAQEDRFGVCVNFQRLDRDNARKLLLASDFMRDNKDLASIKSPLSTLEGFVHEDSNALGEKEISHELQLIQNTAINVAMGDAVTELILDIRDTISSPDDRLRPQYIRDAFHFNVDPARSDQTIRRLSRAFALMDGRDVVLRRDVIRAIEPVYNHRLTPVRSEKTANEALKQLVQNLSRNP